MYIHTYINYIVYRVKINEYIYKVLFCELRLNTKYKQWRMLGLHKYTKNVTINIHIKLYRKCFDLSVLCWMVASARSGLESIYNSINICINCSPRDSLKC